MKINTTIWIDWENQRIITSEAEKNEVMESAIDDGDCANMDFETWLDETYCASEVYQCSEDELLSEFDDWKQEQADEWFEDNFTAHSIKIEV